MPKMNYGTMKSYGTESRKPTMMTNDGMGIRPVKKRKIGMTTRAHNSPMKPYK